ncbi:MAG: ATP synthase F1 subunit delta [Thermoleophilia bacterium]|nr:ATP synthase F1 subunit delta [Thermoleophilia bacterium]
MAVASRIYARALFEAASGQGRVAQVRAELEEFAGALAASPELEAFLGNPQVDSGSKAGVLAELSEGADPLVRNALQLVASKGRSGELAAIVRAFEEIADRAEGRLVVELVTAQPLADNEAASIVQQIEDASGRRVEATRSVDPALVGGLVLQAGSLRLDASVRGRLERLRRDLVTR